MYGLVDCNNFYVSCERVFNPLLRNKPVVVLSNNDGCIIARSNEAKSLGIPMGAPLHLYKTLIKKNKIFTYSSNYTLYGDMSSRVMSSLNYFVPDMEIYSIDEAFLDLRKFNGNTISEEMVVVIFTCPMLGYSIHSKMKLKTKKLYIVMVIFVLLVV